MTQENTLVELNGSDYEIVNGQPDITGWDVMASNNHSIGEVLDVLFDPQSRKVRYMIVDLDANDLVETDRVVLIPIGIAELHATDSNVILPTILSTQLQALPLYERGKLNPETEEAIRNIFAVPGTIPASGHDFYDHTHFNEQRFYGSRWKLTVDDASFPLHDHDPSEKELEGDMPEPARTEPEE